MWGGASDSEYLEPFRHRYKQLGNFRENSMKIWWLEKFNSFLSVCKI